jgi:predicted  nucleic acid-binding Zn-ribbon protein
MVGRPSKKGEQFKLTLGLFMCPKCERTFRAVVGKEKEKITLNGMVNEIKGIERRLEHTLGGLQEKLEKLKGERSELLDKIDGLKRAGEERVHTLEEEIVSLRQEVDSLKELLDEIE